MLQLLDLFLIILNANEEYKITYTDHKDKNTPIIISREKILLRTFELFIKNQVIEIIENSEHITIFPLKKA
jgi:hypothetical protein